MNQDNQHRKYRFVEVLDKRELNRTRRGEWPLVDGWLQLALREHPGQPAALVEGDYTALLPDGSLFKEVSFKVEHQGVEDALRPWATNSGRRWAIAYGNTLVRSDGSTFLAEQIELLHG